MRKPLSSAELIREAIRQYLYNTTEKMAAKYKARDSLLSIVGMCKTGIKDDSERVDEIIYRKAKR